MTEHLCECDGNGVVTCHWCMGAGVYEEPQGDDPEDTVERPCTECVGCGLIPCPGCGR